MEPNEISFIGVDKPHDRLIKWSYGQLPVARDFFGNYSPDPVVAWTNWSNLAGCPGSFVSPDLVESHTDLLFKAPMLGATIPIYFYFLFEHLTNLQRMAALRLAGYKLDIWNKLRAESRKGDVFRLPYILTFVVHQGDGWTPPTKIADLMQRPKSAPAELLDCLQELELNMGYIPVTVDSGLKGHILGRVTLALMNAASKGRGLEFFDERAEMIEELLQQPDSVGMLRTLLRYMFQVDDRSWQQREKIVKHLKNHIIQDNAMSIADQLIAHGQEQGQVQLTCQFLERKLGNLSKAARSKVEKLPSKLLVELLNAAHSFEKPAHLNQWLKQSHDS